MQVTNSSNASNNSDLILHVENTSVPLGRIWEF